jgi:DNA-binding NtrC family response regulator
MAPRTGRKDVAGKLRKTARQPMNDKAEKSAGATDLSRVPPSLRERVRQATRRIESEIILQELEQNRWNRRRTAETLRISYRSLMYKMKSGNLRDASSRRLEE